MNLESAGDAPKVSMTHTVAVYEPSGGRVVHLYGGREAGIGEATLGLG